MLKVFILYNRFSRISAGVGPLEGFNVKCTASVTTGGRQAAAVIRPVTIQESKVQKDISFFAQKRNGLRSETKSLHYPSEAMAGQAASFSSE
jgi:hypothetical protein